MFKKHSFQVKMVKDSDVTSDPTLVDAIRAMSPEELEELNRKLMRRAAFTVGGIIVTKIAATLIAGLIATAIEKKLEG